jgi:acyl carrier protein
MLDKSKGALTHRVVSLVGDILAQNKITRGVPRDAVLTEIGLTSIDMVNLMLAVEAEFDVLIPAGDITPANFRSVATIEAMLVRISDVAA